MNEFTFGDMAEVLYLFTNALTRRNYGAAVSKDDTEIEVYKDCKRVFTYSIAFDDAFNGQPTIHVTLTPEAGDDMYRLHFSKNNPRANASTVVEELFKQMRSLNL